MHLSGSVQGLFLFLKDTTLRYCSSPEDSFLVFSYCFLSTKEMRTNDVLLRQAAGNKLPKLILC